MTQIHEQQRAVRVFRPGRPIKVDERPKTPAVQLEIAAQWLKEAAIVATAAKDVELSMQLSRVAYDCEVAARRAV